MNLKKILIGIAAFLTALAGGYQANELIGAGRLNYQERFVMNDVVATTTGAAHNVADFRNVGITVGTSAASGTLKFVCSMSETAPVFSTAQSSTNRWDYVEIIDLQDGASIDGDTGLTLANTTDVRQFELNTNNLRWCTAILSPWTAGTTTVMLLPATNQ